MAPLSLEQGDSPELPRPSDGWRALRADDPVEVIDMTDSPPREHLSPFANHQKTPRQTPKVTFPAGLQQTVTEIQILSTDSSTLATLITALAKITMTSQSLRVATSFGERRNSERVSLSNKERLLEHAFKNNGRFITLNSRGGEAKG